MNKLPIAEHFHSIQGEGTFTGKAMHFIRLAGCSVGHKASKDWTQLQQQEGKTPSQMLYGTNALPILHNGQLGSKCQTYDGRFFDCDTDFSVHHFLSVEELIEDTFENHICLTGGEPLNHQKNLISFGLFSKAFERKIQIHVETSGTVMIDERLKFDGRVWLTVSPKAGYLPEMIDYASEVKLLVDDKFDVGEFSRLAEKKNVFLSPINAEMEVNHANVKIVRELQKKYPNWTLSCQWHKFLGMR